MRREDLAQALADAAPGVPGVARLGPGGAGWRSRPSSPGGRWPGSGLGGEGVEMHIVADRVPLPPVADQVGAAVGAVLARGR